VNDVFVKYVGQKPIYTVQFPVPTVAKSEFDGDPVEFRKNKPVKLSYQRAMQLLKHAPAMFEKVEDEPRTSHKA
jgi:hypothetical protein